MQLVVVMAVRKAVRAATNTFTFMIGYVPVTVSVNPVLYLKFDANVEGSAQQKCEYNYSNWFKDGE